MRSGEALTTFEKRLRSRDLAAGDLDAWSASEAMLAFYAEARAEDVDLDADGDMLLFQWGTRGSGSGRSFEYNITRQFITEPSDDNNEGILQLSLSLWLPPDDETARLGHGDHWHPAPSNLAKFASYINAHPGRQ